MKVVEAYYDVKAPGNYGGIDAVFRLMKQRGKTLRGNKWSTGWQSKKRTAYTSPSKDVSLDEIFIREELITCGKLISSTLVIWSKKTTDIVIC